MNLSKLVIVSCTVVTAISIFSSVFAGTNSIYKFRAKHPELSTKYQSLIPVAFESYERQSHLTFTRVMGYVRVIRKRFPENDELQAYADRIEKEEREILRSIDSYFESLRKNIEVGDSVWEFTFIDNGVREIGFLVLDKGRIKMREIILSEPIERANGTND